jgi:hypothetical protein
VDPNDSVRGIVPAEAAQKMAGTYASELAWFDDNALATNGTWEERGGTGIDDEITITLEYEGGPAIDDSCAGLNVDVEVTYSTASGLSGSAPAALEIRRPAPVEWLYQGDGYVYFTGGDIDRMPLTFWASGPATYLSGEIWTLPPYEPHPFGRFPARGPSCHADYELDEPGLVPTAQDVIDRLHGLAPTGIPWTGEPEPFRIELTPDEERFCDGPTRAEIPASATLVLASGTRVPADANFDLIHDAFSPTITRFELQLVPRALIQSGELYPDDEPCSFGDVEITLGAAVTEAGLTIDQATIFAGCAR